MNKTRKALARQYGNTHFIPYEQIRKTARVPAAERTTVAKAFRREGLFVKVRPNREKPQRTAEHRQERKIMCDTIRKRPSNIIEGTKSWT